MIKILNETQAMKFMGTDGSAITITNWVMHNQISLNLNQNPIEEFVLNGVSIMSGDWLIKCPTGRLILVRD